jgi:hypothetical protein
MNNTNSRYDHFISYNYIHTLSKLKKLFKSLSYTLALIYNVLLIYFQFKKIKNELLMYPSLFYPLTKV